MAQVAQQPHGAGQAQHDDGHRQGQVELLQPCQREARVDQAGAYAQRGAHARIASRPRGCQQYVPVAREHQGNGRQVEHQEPLNAARHMEHFPLVPVGSVDLMQDQEQHGPEVAVRHNIYIRQY
eukprot:gene16119-19179_t